MGQDSNDKLFMGDQSHSKDKPSKARKKKQQGASMSRWLSESKQEEPWNALHLKKDSGTQDQGAKGNAVKKG
ncbi:uncharacterized protein PG998_010587 [Apiospora kogelbergensis]|uniref:uncharacterized protein n=1 Tax=Apiospora kogelbergensis TaxID=1337665 RepID=UPI00312FD640